MPFACRFVLPVTLPAASFTDPAAFFAAPSILFVLIALVLSCVVEPLPCDQRGCQARGSPSTLRAAQLPGPRHRRGLAARRSARRLWRSLDPGVTAPDRGLRVLVPLLTAEGGGDAGDQGADQHGKAGEDGECRGSLARGVGR